MISKISLKKAHFTELILIDHRFSLEEYLLVKKTLKMYSPGIWIPIGIDVFSPDIQKQRRALYHDICKLFQNYTSDWGFSYEEAQLIEDALKHFITLPLPLYEDVEKIRERKKDRYLGKNILSYLKH
jgi:hypothetical protein